MTLDEAFLDFVNSERYKEVVKQQDSLGGKYRAYLSRYNKGQLKAGAIVEILLANGYEIKANRVVKKANK
ncbi:MAG: hypothetical protein KIT80_16145 [Chitinophagaceae bacterium]|nr:hypothetical protein [Chitinophagaceae bacterium]MCW5928448.1 hypothetical protein [Chitinophagaceae bacterium]